MVGSRLTLSGPKKANERRGEEQDRAQESKGNGGLVLAALVAVDRVDVVPVEYMTAAAADKVDKDAECDPEENAEHKVDWPVSKGARKRNKPNQSKEDAKGRNDFGVDESPSVVVDAPGVAEIFAVDTSDNGSKDELCTTKDQADKAVEGHDDDDG